MTRRITVTLPVLLALATPALAQSDFRGCLSGLRAQAAASGISGAAFDTATRGLEPDLKVPELKDNQPELKTQIWDYIAGIVDEEGGAKGRAAMHQPGQALATAESRFGVDRHIIAGVWGVK